MTMQIHIKKSTLLFFSIVSFLYNIAFTQSAIHEWKYYINTAHVTQIATSKNDVFAAFENGLLQYDVNANEKTIWSVTNYLSDVYIESIYYDSISDGCWIGYKNGNIDFIKNNQVINLPFFKISEKMGDKRITHFQNEGKIILASFPYGILKLNIDKKEVTDTYYPPLNGLKINDFKIFNDSIFVLTDTLIFVAQSKNTLLANEKNWSSLPNTNKLTFQSFHLKNNNLYIETSDHLLYSYNKGSFEKITTGYFSGEINYTHLYPLSNNWALVGYDGVQLLNNQFEEKEVIYRYDGKNYPQPNCIAETANRFWIGDHLCGLVKWKDNYNNEVLNIPGLPKSSVFTVAYSQNQLGVTSGVISKTGFEYNADGIYINQGENWKLIDRYNQVKWKNKLLFDIGSISFNPKKKGEFAVGSNSFVPLSISYGGQQIDTIFTDSNSILKKSVLSNGFSFVSDLKYDENGNLWILNPYTSNPLKVYTKEQTWKEISTSSSTTNSWARKIVIDYQGNKWVSFPGIGIVGVNTQKDIENSSDDVTRIINEGEATGALPSKEINALAVDFDNNLWIGTDAGFAILYNAPAILNGKNEGFITQRIKLKYEGNVEYLLGKTSISDIEIDGGNRKWIATTNAGLFLLSADGNELLLSFTKENGSLISNNISDIQFNQDTGELFVVTDLGLVSYRVDATYAKDNYESTLVFPNPYKKEHTKGITIQGIKYDSDVKITDAAGNLIYKTTSNGGTAFWNANDWNGNRVAPGVYFFWTAPNNGDGKKVGKVVVF
jgi:hypothetical protein